MKPGAKRSISIRSTTFTPPFDGSVSEDVYEMLYFADTAPTEARRSLGSAVEQIPHPGAARRGAQGDRASLLGTTRRLEERIHELEARNEALRLNETNGGV